MGINPFVPFKQVGTDTSTKASNLAQKIDRVKPTINIETLAVARTLLTTDYMVQWLNPNGVSRDVVLPAEASSTNLMFILLNTGTVSAFNLVVQNAAAVTVATLGPGMTGMFSCDGSSWKWENDEGIYYDNASSVTNKRDVASGVAGLDEYGNVLAPGNNIKLTRSTIDDVIMEERTSGEVLVRWHRYGAENYEGNVRSGGAWSTIQLANMKDVALGIASLDASSKQVPAQHFVGVPATAGAAGVAGQMAYVSGYLYICVATNTWERTAIATW